jgi:hypothetical protein
MGFRRAHHFGLLPVLPSALSSALTAKAPSRSLHWTATCAPHMHLSRAAAHVRRHTSADAVRGRTQDTLAVHLLDATREERGLLRGLSALHPDQHVCQPLRRILHAIARTARLPIAV